MNKTRTCLLLLSGLALSLPAAAHPGHAETGFAAGLLHPLTGLDHLLALLAVGLWSWPMAANCRAWAAAPASCWPARP
jgi:urease accessory protein